MCPAGPVVKTTAGFEWLSEAHGFGYLQISFAARSLPSQPESRPGSIEQDSRARNKFSPSIGPSMQLLLHARSQMRQSTYKFPHCAESPVRTHGSA